MGVRKKGMNYFIDYYVGPKRYREIVGPNRREAEAALGKKLGEIREGRFFDRKGYPETTIEELEERFLEWAKLKKSVEGYLVHSRPIVEHFKKRFLSSISEHDVKRFRAVRKDTPTRNGIPRSNSTVNHELAMLKAMMNKAVAWGLLKKNPAAKVKPLPEPKRRTQFLSLEEAKRLIDASSRHLHLILIFALETGARRGEILGERRHEEHDDLLPGDEERKIETRPDVEPSPGDACRPPPPPRFGLRVHREHTENPRRERKEAPLNQPIGKVGLPSHNVRTAFENACAKTGIENFRFHDPRHTAASHMIMAGVPSKTVGEILGHTTTAMTERYSHLTPEHKRRAIEMLSATFDGLEDFTGHHSGTK